MKKTLSEKIELSRKIDEEIKNLQQKQKALEKSTITVRWGDLVKEVQKLTGVAPEKYTTDIGCYHIVYSSGHTTRTILDEVRARVEDGSNGKIRIGFKLTDYKNFKFNIETVVDPFKDQSVLQEHITLEPVKNIYGTVTAITLVPSDDLLLEIPFSALLADTEKCHPVEILQKAVENCEKKLEQENQDTSEIV